MKEKDTELPVAMEIGLCLQAAAISPECGTVANRITFHIPAN